MSALFKATRYGRPIMVDHATVEELKVLTATSSFEPMPDPIERWCPVAIRGVDDDGSRVHALGWRAGLSNTWITSRLIAVDLIAGAVATLSSHVYQLTMPDQHACIPI